MLCIPQNLGGLKSAKSRHMDCSSDFLFPLWMTVRFLVQDGTKGGYKEDTKQKKRKVQLLSEP